jgi:hypothetical protein
MAAGRLTPSRLLSMVVMPVLLSGIVTLGLRPLGVAWGIALEWLAAVLRLPGSIDYATVSLGTVFAFQVPFLQTPGPHPGTTHLWIVGAACCRCATSCASPPLCS